VELESQIQRVHNAGEDAVITVIAFRNAMLSLEGE
jgi:hypothetical protein